MRAKIDLETKVARITLPNIFLAGWVGFCFARDHRDLTDQGWVLYYYRSSPDDRAFSLSPGVGVMVDGGNSEHVANAIADLIRRGPLCPRCGRPPCCSGGKEG